MPGHIYELIYRLPGTKLGKQCIITAIRICRKEKNSEDSTSDTFQTTDITAPENVSDGECVEPAMESETLKQRRVEATTSKHQELSTG